MLGEKVDSCGLEIAVMAMGADPQRQRAGEHRIFDIYIYQYIYIPIYIYIHGCVCICIFICLCIPLCGCGTGGFSGGVFFFCAFAIKATMGKRVVARLDEVIRR